MTYDLRRTVSASRRFAATPFVGTPATYLEKVQAFSALYWPLKVSSGVTTFPEGSGSGLSFLGSGSLEYVEATLAQDDNDGRCLGLSRNGSTVLTRATNAVFNVTAGGWWCLYQADDLDDKHTIVARDEGAGGTGRYDLGVMADGSLRGFRIDGGSTTRVVQSNPGLIVPGAVHLIGIDWGAAGLRITLDGQVVAAEATPTTNWATATTAGIRVGRWYTGITPADGVMGWLMFRHSQPTLQEITALAATQNVVAFTGAVLGSITEGSQASFNVRDYGHFPTGSLTANNAGLSGPVTLAVSGATFTVTGSSVSTNTAATVQISVTYSGGTTPARTFSITVTDVPVVGGEIDPAWGTGTIVNLGTSNGHNSSNSQTLRFLSNGGNTRYDARGMIGYMQWNGEQGCFGDDHHSSWSNMFLFRYGSSATNGGALFGGAVYTNVTRHDDYDSADNGYRLYPCADGGQVFIGKDGDVQNHYVANWRFHGTWDPIRFSGTSSITIQNIIIKGNWCTCNRDDFIENDTYRSITVEDNLMGDITARDDSGTLVFLSMRTSGVPSSNHNSRIVTVRDNLVHMQRQRATHPDRANDVNGYVVGACFKLQKGACRIDCFDNVFFIDGISTIGDTFRNITRTDLDAFGNLPRLRNSSGNIIIWNKDGTYPYTPPPGFTVFGNTSSLTARRAEWNSRVAAWKAAHPHVQRLNKTGIPRPNDGGGGTVSINDALYE